MQNITLIYFAGCGGVSLGAQVEGYKIIGVEWNANAANLYKNNIAGECIVADVSTLNSHLLDIPSPTKRKELGIHLVWQLSPPCQDFSKLNKQKDSTSIRANILRDIFSHLDTLQPEYIWLENVKAYRKSEVYQDFCKLLRSQDYLVSDSILNFYGFGVPQRRERLIMLAGKYSLPVIQPAKNLVSWYEAIVDLIPNLPISKLTATQAEAIKGYNLPVIVERTGYYNGKPKVTTIDKPVWTIRAALGDDGKGNRNKFIDVVLANGEVRSLTVQALARLQTFPDWYKWSGQSAIDVRGIGNSVPPLISQAIFKAIKQHDILGKDR
jgi:DNA (cytosine-5)-methyltransferase 1